MLVLYLLLLTCSAALQAQPAAPRDLHATVATSRAVNLAWTPSAGASGYTVERRTLSEQQFKPLSATAIADAHVTDSSIDAFATYVYRVRALSSGKPPSAASNEIRVGPPPVGLSAVVPTPAGLKDPDYNFAQVPQMILDANGDPAMTYYVIKGDRGADSELYFVAWDRAAYHWRAPVMVTKAGPVDITRPALPFSLAHDAETNMFGIALPADRREGTSRSVALALSSDGGVTWDVKRAASGTDARFGSTSLAMGGGQVYLAWEQDATVQYAAGKEADDPGTWVKMTVPTLAAKRPRTWYPSLALDAAGKPGLAYLAASADDYNAIIGFWRPGGAPVKVADSNNIQNDSPKVRLDFHGTQPRVIAEITRTKANPRTGLTDNIWFVAATDEGATWANPIAMPWDGAMRMGRPEIAAGPHDQVAVMMDAVGGSGGDQCGNPKLARSNDLVQWKTCSPLGARKPKLKHADSGQIRYGGNGKLYAVMANRTADTGDAPAPVGLILWREP